MPQSSQSVYELRRIRNSSDRSLVKALKIYFQNIDPLIRTDPDDIIHWLDIYNERFKDRFYIVTLYLNDVMVGYGQFTFCKEERLVFIDYMAIEESSRKNNTFYEFVEKIKDFFIEENIQYNYIVTEVGYYKEKKELTEVGKNLIRLLKMTGFGVIKMAYYQPMLGKKNFETEIGGLLMIHTANDSKTLKLETFFNLIDTIYIKIYKRWHDEFLNEQEQLEYSVRLSELKKKIESSAKNKQEIEINGYPNFLPVSQTAMSSSNYVRIAKLVGVFLIFSVLATLIGSLVLWLRKKYNLGADSISLISVGSLIVIVLASRIFYRSEHESLTSAIEKIFKLFN